MSFDKIYPNRKDKRKQYPGKPRSIDHACRPGGGCPACAGSRARKDEKKMSAERE